MLVEGVSGKVRDAPPRKDIVWQEERAGRVNNSYVTVSNGA